MFTEVIITYLSRSLCFGPMMYTDLAPLAIKVVVIIRPMPYTNG